jgi:hypothetical protein
MPWNLTGQASAVIAALVATMLPTADLLWRRVDASVGVHDSDYV